MGEPSAQQLAQDVLDRHCKSYVESAIALARYVVNEKGPLSQSQEDCAKLRDQVATLKLLIEGISRATPEDRAGVIAAALEFVSKMP